MQRHYIMKVKALHNENQNKLWGVYYRTIIKDSGHYTKMWFLWLGHVATITQNSHVVVSELDL